MPSRTSSIWPVCKCRSAGRSAAGREGQRPRYAGRLRGHSAKPAAVQRLVYASSAAVFGTPEHYPVGSLADDVLLTPSTHYGVFKCCNEGKRPNLLPGPRPVEHRPAALDGVRRRPRLRHDQRADQGDPSAGPRPALPHHYGGLQDLQFVDDVAKTFIRCLDAPYQVRSRTTFVAMSSTCRRFTGPSFRSIPQPRG